jgi:hypothetical protein
LAFLLILLAQALAGAALAATNAPAAAATGLGDKPAAAWWNDAWPDRYHVVFPPRDRESGAEVGTVTFRAVLGEGNDPYNIRAVSDAGTSVPVRVLNWTPDEPGLPDRGEAMCLVAGEALSTSTETALDFYLGNRAAVPAAWPVEWENPTLVVGPVLPRAYNRHGEWIWRPDAHFGAVHLGWNPDRPRDRSSHSVTNLPSYPLHATQTRFVQMVWLDPAAPTKAISIDFFLDGRIQSVYWTDDAKPPEDTVATAGAKKVGDLPAMGHWVRLEVMTAKLDVKNRSILAGIGFSNHGGIVRWGPTAIGALPLRGVAVRRETLRSEPGEKPRIETVALATEDAPTTATFEINDLRLDLLQAPLFSQPDSPLLLTWFVSPSPRHVGRLEDCELRLMALSRDGAEREVSLLPVTFTGGDNWQRTVEIPADAWRGAEAVEARLRRGPTALATVRFRLAALGPVAGLRANGNLLETDAGPLAFVLTAPAAGAASTALAPAGATATLLFHSGLRPPLGDSATTVTLPRPPPDAISVQSADARLGLGQRLAPGEPRTAAEWVVAAAHAAAPDSPFGHAWIVADPSLTETGLVLEDVEVFLGGIIELLQSNPRLDVTLDCERLRAETHTRRDRALLARCLAVKPLVRTKSKPNAAARSAGGE